MSIQSLIINNKLIKFQIKELKLTLKDLFKKHTGEVIEPNQMRIHISPFGRIDVRVHENKYIIPEIIENGKN